MHTTGFPVAALATRLAAASPGPQPHTETDPMSRRSNHSGDGPPPLPGESRRGCGKTLFVILLVVGGVTFAGLAAVGTLMEMGVMNSGEIERGVDLNDKTREILEDTFLRTDETVIWFYSADLIDAALDGNVLTDQRVVSYFNDTEGEVAEKDELYVDWARLEDITAVRVKLSGTFIEDSELQVWREETAEDGSTGEDGPGESLLLYLTADEGIDHLFVEDLVRLAREHGATIVSVEMGGDVSPAQIAAIDGAVLFEGEDWDSAPDALLTGESGD
jgi:hypothetical protein